ncbi:hypothetical protein [Telluribacter sp.]|jgi:YD repeat-containing protein|uniref:hypothetical protein n=1 Tax=Telluribacter sp. TaxID=1978767 RepID=UPI002E0F1A45|nr:hypothetical protein [Telluribacter sp.]
MKDTSMKTPLIYLFFLVMALLAGCKKNEPEKNPTGCLIKAETLNGNPYRSYEYDEQNRLYRMVQYKTDNSASPEKRYTFEYNQDGKVILFRETGLAAPFQNFQYEPIYDEEGKVNSLTQSRLLNSGPQLVQTNNLEYDDRKRVTKFAWDATYWRYEYDENGNLTRWYIKVPAVPAEVLVAEYENYDGRQNLYLFSDAVRMVNLISGGGASSQNPGSFKFYGPAGGVSQTGVVTYEYTEKDLPSQASVSLFSQSGQASTQVYGFEYECL